VAVQLDGAEVRVVEAPNWNKGLVVTPEPGDPTGRGRVLGLLPIIKSVSSTNVLIVTIDGHGAERRIHADSITLIEPSSLSASLGLKRFHARGTADGLAYPDMEGTLSGSILLADGFVRLSPAVLKCPARVVPLETVIAQVVPPFGFTMRPYIGCR
jgi:hypothetical protein